MSGELMPRVQHQIETALVIAFGCLDADEHIVQCGGRRFRGARLGSVGMRDAVRVQLLFRIAAADQLIGPPDVMDDGYSGVGGDAVRLVWTDDRVVRDDLG